MDCDRASDSNNDLPRMSIKDRIRAMNLDAGQRNTGHSKPFSSLPRTRFSERGSGNIRMSADCDLSTLKTTRNTQKPSGLMSDPGVGYDSHTVAAAINMWRRRALEEKSKDKPKGWKEDYDEEGIQAENSGLSNQLKPNHDNDVRIDNKNGFQNVFPPSRSPIHQTNEGAFVKPKLKPVRKAPYTLKLIEELRAKQSLAGEDKVERCQAIRPESTSSDNRKISDRIKVFNSAKNWNRWKPVAPPIHQGQSKRIQTSSKHSNNYEDASIDSSERQSLDEDSTSNCTPRVSGNSARILAQPPTPSSYVSDSVYTAASSGEGAVVGSVGSSQQLNRIENRYAAMSTPETSIAGNDDSSGTSSKQQQIYPSRPLKIQSSISVRPHMKNSLQSKLEYDKARAIRRSMLVRKQNKTSSNNVLTQKKDQDPSTKPIGGHTSLVQTKKADGRLEKFLSPTARSDLQSHTKRMDAIRKKDTVSPLVMDAPDDEAASMNHTVKSQKVESLNECKSSEHSLRSKSNEKIPMKADAMKEIIRRRRRRKEFQAGKMENDRESEKSPKLINRTESEVYTSVKKAKETPQDTDCNVKDVSEGEKQSKMLILDKKIEAEKDDYSKLLASARSPEVSLPPEIQRSTKKASSSKGTVGNNDVVIASKPISFESNPIESSDLHLQINPEAIDPSRVIDNSISVASSLIYEEDTSDDEDDEPEPVVDSFIIELSPIKSQDTSKHIFDTSTIYHDSPSSYSSFNPQEYASEKTESTPKRGSRDNSMPSSNCSSVHGSGSLPGANQPGSADCSPENKPQQSRKKMISVHDSKDGVSVVSPCQDTEVKCRKSKSFVNDAASEASSGIRSITSAISAISSVFSTNSGKANKILSERRSKAPTEDKTHALDLARKIIYDRSSSISNFQNGPKTHSVEKNGTFASETRMENCEEEDTNKVTDEARQNSSEALKMESEVNHVSNDDSLTSNVGSDDVEKGQLQLPQNSILMESIESSDSHHDKSQSLDTNDMSTSVETVSELNCYKYSFLHMDKIPNISEICGDINELELTSSMNTSAISAVRISQQNDDDDIPFDEEVAIEVEYLTNEDMESLTSRKKKDEIMMLIPTTFSKYPMTNILISSTSDQRSVSDYNTPNYISESSCENDTSDDFSFNAQQAESQQV